MTPLFRVAATPAGTLAGSRFLSSAEERYAPVEGEALAVACGLEQTNYFTQGCDNLVVVMYDKPLVKIFGDRTLDEITSTRFFRLKQRTLLRRFENCHLPGPSNQTAGAASRHPVSCNFIATVLPVEHDSPDVVEQALAAAIQREASENVCLQWRDIVDQTSCDLALSKLLLAIESYFDDDVSNSYLIQSYLPFRKATMFLMVLLCIVTVSS